MINLKASHKTPTINVGCNPVTTVRIENSKGSSEVTTDGNGAISYPKLDGAVQMPGVQIPNSAFISVSPGSPGYGQVSSFASTTDIPIPLSEVPEIAALQRENAVLKLIIDIQHSNPMIVNKYIVADDQTLTKMVGLLCNATEVHLDAEDIGVGCVSKKTYRKVHSIYVTVDGKIKNLKYDFSDVMKILKDLHISTKFVW